MDTIMCIMGIILFSAGIITLLMRPCCYDMEAMALLMVIGGILIMLVSFFINLEEINCIC